MSTTANTQRTARVLPASSQAGKEAHEPWVKGWLGEMCVGVVAAVVIGVAAGLLTLLLYRVELWTTGYHEAAGVAWPRGSSPLMRVVALSAVSCMAAVVWWYLRHKTRRVPSVRQAVAGDKMPWWQTIIHVLLQIVLVGAGASIGREVAPRELGALVAQRVGALCHMRGEQLRCLVAASAGAGLAGVYDAPLAGVFFTVEILGISLSVRHSALALLMSALAAQVAQLIKGNAPFYDIAALHAQPAASLTLAAVAVGALCGVLGAYFRMLTSVARARAAQSYGILWQLPFAGLATGLVAMALPEVMGNGRAAAQSALMLTTPSWSAAGIVAALLVAKALMTLLTLCSGASGGVLQPGIALGALCGGLFGMVWVHVCAQDTIAACALIGAAALLAASQQAPFMAMSLVLALANVSMGYVLPVGVGVATALIASSAVRGNMKRIPWLLSKIGTYKYDTNKEWYDGFGTRFAHHG